MKRYLVLILIYSVCAVPVLAQLPFPATETVTHIATALNHLSVLEFQEPVTLAAAGSTDFQIERKENKVFIKPMKAGASTDLFVWTASRRFAYELETTSEVKNMNFAIDHLAPAPAPPLAVSTRADELADMVLTRAFLGAQEISNSSMRARKEVVTARVEQVFRTSSTIYVHYTIENNSEHAYRVVDPNAYQLQVAHSSIALGNLVHKQLTGSMLRKLGNTQQLSLPIAHRESEAKEIGPGEAAEGVVAIRQDLDSPAVVELVFEGQVKATFVL